MMPVIWKYELQPVCTIEMPHTSKILRAGVQDDSIMIWVKVVPDSIKIKRRFVVFGTGHEIPNDLELQYIDTVFLPNGLVFHIFEVL